MTDSQLYNKSLTREDYDKALNSISDANLNPGKTKTKFSIIFISEIVYN